MKAASYVYVGNSESQDVTVLELKGKGILSQVATVGVPGPSTPGGSLPMALAPDKRFLYVGLRNEPYSVATFSIDAQTGNLAYIGSAPLADSMAYIVTDRSGRFLLSASYGGNKITVNLIGPDGVVQSTLQIVTTQPNAHCILTDASNQWVLHTSLGGDLIGQLQFDEKTGKLTPSEPAPRAVQPKSGPRHLVFAPDQRYVYVLGELDASIRVFPFDSTKGTLREQIQSINLLPPDFEGKLAAADIHLTPDGKFLYASERTTSMLAAFGIDGETGMVKLLGSYPTARQPRAFNIDPSGHYLLTVGELSNSLVIYAIHQTNGTLTALQEYSVGKKPNWVEIVALP